VFVSYLYVTVLTISGKTTFISGRNIVVLWDAWPSKKVLAFQFIKGNCGK